MSREGEGIPNERYDDTGEGLASLNFDNELLLLLEQENDPEKQVARNERYASRLTESMMISQADTWAREQGNNTVILISHHDDVDVRHDKYIRSVFSTVENEVLQDPVLSELYGTSAYAPFLQIRCLEKLIEEREFQAHVIKAGAESLLEQRKNKYASEQNFDLNYKKVKDMSILQGIYPEKFTRDWQDFYDKATPGNAMDYWTYGNCFFDEEIEDLKYERLLKKAYDEKVLEEMIEVMGYAHGDMNGDALEAKYTARVLQVVATDYYEVSAANNGRVERNKLVCEHAHACELDAEMIGKLAELLDEKYPIEPAKAH